MSENTEVLDTIEKTLDEIDVTIDTIEKLSAARSFMAKHSVHVAAASAVALTAGAVGGYFFAKNKLRSYYEEIADREIAEAKAFYAVKKPASPSDLVEERGYSQDAEEALKVYQGKSDEAKAQEVVEAVDVIEEQTEVVKNIFDGHIPVEDDKFDYEAEVAKRNPEVPYVITHDEFYENETEYEQASLTWFEGDGVLVDDKDVMIPEIESTVGHNNMERFGHASKDANMVYIRNERMELDFEVARSNGSYTQEVLGMDIEEGGELKHSHRPRRFRDD